MLKSKNFSSNGQRIIKKTELYKEYESAKESLKRKFGLSQMLGRSKVTQELREKIDKILKKPVEKAESVTTDGALIGQRPIAGNYLKTPRAFWNTPQTLVICS